RNHSYGQRQQMRFLENYLTVKILPLQDTSRLYDPVGIVEEFAKAIRLELDYGTEGRNAERFRKNFEDDET
ncbi:MAG: hypothetical protein COW35_01945, partial [Candidatus Infernicultor aquiphilus]